ncbi:zinc finger FYVE domain-containing protein 26-like isoform X1 [Haliotis rufescens]|uniref:zinc finger FYVE domain-containing protein 26-like isoform X1 n=1 Tax=Haliotis rufescens TaxID=6454 RepID=UPI00201EB83B|nr:zinc finger FYVE domain-containing protein 26-like isoform X1 [Haliotis rufescens]
MASISQSSRSHPSSINREGEETIAMLYKSFSNNLLLGQWELARACLSQLSKDCHQIGVNIKDVLRKVAAYPFDSSYGSASLSSPHELSWLCLLECQQLEDWSEDKNESPSYLSKEIQFRLLLTQTCQEADSEVIKELYLWFKHIHSTPPTSSQRASPLPKGTLTHIQHVLLTWPSQGFALITALTPPQTHERQEQKQQKQRSNEERNSENLQGVYLDCINKHLDTLSKCSSKERTKCEQIFVQVYTLLSFYNPVPFWNYSQLQQLFTRLLQLSHQHDCSIRKDKILSVLLGRDCPYLVETFCKLDHELSLASKVKHGGTDRLTDSEKDVIHLFRGLDSEECWRNLFLLSTQRQRHFLQMVLETSLSLIRCGQFEELKDLLRPTELHPLKPVVLLLGWSLCTTSTVARKLLDVLWDEKTPCRHPALAAGCRKLAYQIDLIQWCLDRTKPLLESSGVGVTNQERATHLLQGLEAHSVLFVLHQSTTLASLDQQEVLQLLQNTARRQDPESNKKQKSVRFNIAGHDQNGESEADDGPDISIEQQRDLSIYRSFCAIRNIMDAIAFCSDNADLELMNPICVRKAPRPRSLSKSFTCEVSVSSSEGEDSSSQYPQNISRSVSANFTRSTSENISQVIDKDSFQDLYDQCVTQKLMDTQNHLKKLHPLTYRVEVLEDIFSLLFATHRDVQECSNTADFDSDEGGEDGSKRNSQENMSLNTSLISEEDTSPLALKTDFYSSQPPPLSSQSVPARGSGYDEPFREDPPVQVSQSVHKKVRVPQDQLVEEVKKSASALLNSDNTKMTINSTGKRVPVAGQEIDKCEVFKLGFLANEYLVRDLLAMLKESLLNINAVRYKLTGQKSDLGKKSEQKGNSDTLHVTPAMEEALTQIVKSSVVPETLQKRLTRLTQYIHEAQWRFQLVSHDQLPKQPGQVLQRPVFVPGDDNFDVCRSDGWRKGRSRSPNKDKRSASPTLNRENEMQGSPGDVEVRHRRSSGVSRASFGTQSRLVQAGLEIIPLMLSTPDTLLTMSLSKGNFAQAAQVIKLFKLEKSEAAEEVSFSEAYHKAANKVATLESSTRERTGASSNLGRPSMKALAKVAAAGVASASLSNVTDELLSGQIIPSLPKPKTTSNMPENIMRLFKEIDVSTAILLDLVCTSCRTWDLCNKLFDIIKTKVTIDNEMSEDIGWRDSAGLSTSSRKSKSDGGLKGALTFLRQVEKLVHSFADDSNIGKIFTDGGPMTSSKPSLERQMRTGTCPLVSEKVNTFVSVVEDVRRWVDKINRAFENVNRRDSLQLPETSPQVSPKDSSPKFKDSSPKAKDTPRSSPIHIAYKQFCTALERCAPKGGLVYLLKRYGVEASHDKSYLHSLYEHVRELAILVAECDGRTKETLIVPQNYFEMLREGPVTILGRLMFAKRMIPSRLETVAQKLSLNLTHIIVHSCCPRIPSKHLPPLLALQLNQDYEVFGPRLIYNSSQPPPQSPPHPEEIVRHLLDKLITLMKDTAAKSNAQSIFDTSCAKLAMKSEEYRDLLASTSQLQEVDLSQLHTRQMSLCFYANLQNLMTIHLFLHQIWQRTLNQSASDVSDDTSHTINDFVLASTIDSIVHLEQFTYRVGQLGVVSLFELKHVICRIGLPAPVNWRKLISHKSLDVHDRWMKFAPPLESRLLYVLSEGCVSSPPIQVLSPESMDSQLESAMKDYLSHTVEVDVNSRKVTIPSLLSWYKQDFSQGSDEDTVGIDGLINFIVSTLEETKGEYIQQLLDDESTGDMGPGDQPFILTVSDYVFEFSFVFEMSLLPKDSVHSTPHGSLSPPRGLDSSLDSLLEQSDRSFVVETPSYQLTPITLDYVKTDSVLVATMVSLVCADELDDLEYQLQDDNFESSSVKSRTTSMSDISLVDIRSYRYQRLMDDYPILQRHLLNYIIPLAAADNPDILSSSDRVLKFVTNEIDDSVKTCMFSLHDSIQFQQVVMDIINRLLVGRKWSAILLILKSIPEITMKQRRDWQILHDFVLGCWAEEESEHNANSPDIVNRLRRFFCPDSHARSVLSVCSRLPVDYGIDLVESCMVETVSGELKTALTNKLKELKVYLRMTDSVKNLQFKLSKRTAEFVRGEDIESARENHSALEKFTDWRRVVTCSGTSPKEVLSILLQTGDFEMIRDWSKLHPLPQDLKLEIEEKHLMSLLGTDKPNTAKAFQILEEMRERQSSICLSICNSLLKKLTSHLDIQFLTSYMLNQLETELSDSQTEDLRLRHIGAKALLCLPSSIRHEYSHLISTPHLILEQLLMNMKSDLAGKVFQKIKHDYFLVKTASLRYSVDQFNHLLETYATKAVEVMVVQCVESDKERSQSAGSGSSGRTDETDASLTPGQRFLGESIRVRRRGIEGAVSPKPRGQSPIATSPSKRSALPHPAAPSKFVMPAHPPAKEDWVPDSAASNCMVCNERFSMFNRRHHCRRCGRVVCATCSTKRTIIDGESSRTCDECYKQRFGYSDSKSQGEFYSQRRESVMGPGGSLYGSSSGGVTFPCGGRQSDLVAADSWMLRNDETYDHELREEFYYEQAPSVSLCISILGNHSHQKECGQQMLNMCDYLSEFLQPISPGVPNPEVDYSLIISMMRQLLFQAKLKFLHCGENQGVGLCDMYQTRVDLLKILVGDNYKDLPSIKELTKVDTVRRLRDKLIEDERLRLAMEVSTKCGLDTGGVWAAWGLARLHTGDYAGAKEKFSHTLKCPNDKNQLTTSSRLLMEIVDYLESMPITGTTEIQMLLSSPASMKSLINLPSASHSEEGSIETTQFQECLFYLRTYGTFLEHLTFLRRNGYWMKAAQFVLKYRCSSEVFVEALLTSALTSGELGKLLDQMLMLDASLEKWNPYLTATCKYLLKHKLVNALHQVQLFMKDYIRAAMTCITHFYQRRAQSYVDLAGRLQFLFMAQQHMQAFLDPSKWDSVRHPNSSPSIRKGPDWSGHSTESAVRLVLTPDEVTKHIRTIALQTEVTKFLEQCLTNQEGESTALAASYVVESQACNLPTMFGNSKARADLVSMILLSGNDISVSFDLAIRIIQECRLTSSSIFTHTAREMAKHKHYALIKRMLDCVERSGIGNDDTLDEIIRASLLVLADKESEVKEVDNLIKLLRKDSNKINAFILCGKLRSAYLLAVKGERVEDVQRIAGAAQRLNQGAVRNICNKWLQQRK